MIKPDPQKLNSFFVSSLSDKEKDPDRRKQYNVFFDQVHQAYRCDCQYFALYPFSQEKICNHIRRVLARTSSDNKTVIICPDCNHSRSKHGIFDDGVEFCIVPGCDCSK